MPRGRERALELDLVSVVIPTYNDRETLGRAIQSAVDQSYPNLEIIVVNDASTEEIDNVISKYDLFENLLYIKHDGNRGGAAARNTGIAAARGEYIAFLDADDEWMPEKIEKQIHKIERSQYRAVYCDFERIKSGPFPRVRGVLSKRMSRDNSTSRGIQGDDEIVREILSSTFKLGGSSTLLIAQDAVEAIGGFDTSFERHQDWEFVVRLLELAEVKLGFVDEKLVKKYEGDYPDPETIERSKEKFFRKFADRIAHFEEQGYDVRSHHYDYLGIRNLSDGDLVRGVYYLSLGSHELDTILTAVWELFNRFYNHLQ